MSQNQHQQQHLHNQNHQDRTFTFFSSSAGTQQAGSSNNSNMVASQAQGMSMGRRPEEAAGQDKEEVPRSPDGIIDMEIIEQVFEMDDLEDDDDEPSGGIKHEFSKGIVWNYFEQAESTFVDMRNALAQRDLPKLSSLGHFLKGSSAALGVIKVKDSCEKMQNYGKQRDEDANVSLKEEEALEKIRELLAEVQEQYHEAEEWLKRYYRELERLEGA